MADDYREQLSTLITRITDCLDASTPELERAFIARYFNKMPMMELEQLDPQRACLIARNSFRFFQQKDEKLQIRIFNPQRDEHGWQDGRLAIEINNDDMPFILDSLIGELTRLGFQFFETIHPILYLKRDKSGALTKMIDVAEDGSLPAGARAESFIHFQLSPMPDGLTQEALIDDLRRTMASAELVVNDWRPMVSKAQDALKSLDDAARHFDTEELAEAKDFLQWLCNKNFVFLGHVAYDFYDGNGDEKLQIVPESELGIFKTTDAELKPQGLSSLPPEVLHFAREPRLIEITKSNRKSAVHRPVLMDYIAVKRLDSNGKVIGESRFLGLFTSTVYYQSADLIPFIRRKIARTLDRANFDPLGHNGKALKAILEFYPRDELFQISPDDLFRFSINLLTLEARPEVRLFARKDRFERFMSCMAYIPRERFNSYLREQISQILEKAYDGKVTAFYTQLSDSPLARLHMIVTTTPGQIPDVEPTVIEERIAQVANRWADALRTALVDANGEEKGEAQAQRFADAFPDAYIKRYDAISAVYDIQKIERAIASDGLAVDLFRRDEEDDNLFHLKIYTYQVERALSDMLPVLENLGCHVIDVTPISIHPRGQEETILIRDFVLQVDHSANTLLDKTKPLFEECLLNVWQGKVANDPFNGLVLTAGLTWREVEIIRSYSHYMRQIGSPYSRRYIAETLVTHPDATRHIVNAFIHRFDPQHEHADTFKQQLDAIDRYLDKVSNISQDRIIRTFADLVKATLRTNYYQPDADGQTKPYISFKFRSANIPNLPQPVPYAEIFVYSLRVEGIHLRGGEVARGGLRWSDRLEDYRTEVLGLVKAQMVKNAVIVPQGAKGGFVVKHPPVGGDRDAQLQEGIACYRQFLSGLLDITDNLKQGDVIKPANVICHDGDDPYLVVAADKGTATFSDIANALAADYDFWLGDAFASGGSVGYDHKAMGITARGAWVSVARHFREMGIEVDRDDFTVVGIGDMSGDVFGNGMLLSRHIKLVAAFNHRHIFFDPRPNPEASFKERERLFALPRSGWTDYDTSLISAGGGVFDRDQKTIPLTPQVREMLGIDAEQLAPDALINAILKAPVDLLWNGGIGTYVKASDESHEQVGDRTNNGLRVNGDQLRCKVVGEGGNLGLTQRGRIEYARLGGRINTDAIDNSAGVDCSDHEVNIKITLKDAIDHDRLTGPARDKLLESMTDDVSHLVLIDNRLQTQALSIAEYEGFTLLEPQVRMMQQLEQEELLDPEVEYLPNNRQIAEMRARRQGMTRPELAVLLSYSKLALYRDLVDSSMVQSDYFIADLLRYFPKAMQNDYREEILSHRLRGAIVATTITNSIVNRVGITFAHSLISESNMHPCDLARAYVISRDAFRLRALWSSIEALDGTIAFELQAEMFIDIRHFLERTTLWFLENCPEPLDIESVMQSYESGLTHLTEGFESLLSNTLHKAYEQRITHFTSRDVPEPLAKRIAALEILSSACDIVWVANHHDLSVEIVGRIYFELGATLRLGWLRRCAQHMVCEGYWDQLATKSLVREFYVQQRRLTTKVVETLCASDQCETSVETWHQQNEKELKRYYQFIDDLKSQEHVDLAMLTVAARQVESICSL